MRVTIVDCYSDEPAGLGVPPYLGPVPRYVFGAIKAAGQSPTYLNIDDFRAATGRRATGINLTRPGEVSLEILNGSDLTVVLGGSHTPGKYLRAVPGSPREIREIVERSSGRCFVGGPMSESTMAGGRPYEADGSSLGSPDVVITGDPESFLYRELSDEKPDAGVLRDYAELDRYALLGTHVLNQVRRGPDLVCEIETSRGCARSVVGGCAFCSECSRYGLPVFRPRQSIISEVRALGFGGARNVRLGRQSCFFSYMADGVGEREVPVPNPRAIESLLSALGSLALNSLHIDNVNPAVVASHPGSTKAIVGSIVQHCTPGNVAAMGVETADPAVVRRNNLKAMPADALAAVELISRHGKTIGWNGQPSLLPGLNFVLGLPGETRETYRMNREFLSKAVGRGLLLRRTNIRKVIPVKGTRLWGARWPQKALARYSRGFIRWVREKIDRPMLRRVFPRGTIMRGAVAETHRGRTAFCRLPGSYPVVIGVPEGPKALTVLDVFVTDHGLRSLTAVQYPLDLNRCSPRTLESLPGVGTRRAARILSSRPILGRPGLEAALSGSSIPPEELDLVAKAAGLWD